MLGELVESNKQVKQSASVSWAENTTKLPPGQMTELGVKPEYSNCGLVCFNLIPSHLLGGLEGPTFFL